MKIKVDEGGIMPTRAHEDDAGLDIYTPTTFVLAGKSNHFVDTLVHIDIPVGYVGYVKSKSGLMKEYGIRTDGTIDAGYSGTIGVMLFNSGFRPKTFFAGDKIAQIVINPIITPSLEIVDDLWQSERGENGFGSSGR